MADAFSAGTELYTRLAQLLAPADSVAGTSYLVILEPAGKDIAAPANHDRNWHEEMLADLANTVPAAAPTFLDTGRQYDDVWDIVINSAMPTGPIDDPGTAVVARLISDNRFSFAAMAKARTDDPVDTYHPVRASPEDWSGDTGWNSASFRIGADVEAPRPPPAEHVIPDVLPKEFVFPEIIPDLTWRTVPTDLVLSPDVVATINAVETQNRREPQDRLFGGGALGPHLIQRLQQLPVAADFRPVPMIGDETLRWRDLWNASRAIEEVALQTPATPLESGFKLSFDYRVVGIQRPWLRSELCHLIGWRAASFAVDGLSNGRPDDNDGLMPVITTQMLVVRNLVVKAKWADSDQAKAAATNSTTISFGPFALTGDEGFTGSEIRRAAPQIIAWLATIVPACPTT